MSSPKLDLLSELRRELGNLQRDGNSAVRNAALRDVISIIEEKSSIEVAKAYPQKPDEELYVLVNRWLNESNDLEKHKKQPYLAAMHAMRKCADQLHRELQDRSARRAAR